MNIVYLGIGSNQSSPTKQVERANQSIDSLPDTKIILKSSLYETDPVGFKDQPKFINQVICILTKLTVEDLLKHCQKIEHMQKRVRTIIDGPRTIDIDILLYNQEIIKTDDLVVPHPRMHERSFVMFPLKEITTTINIPGIKNINIMVDKLDKNIIKKINE